MVDRAILFGFVSVIAVYNVQGQDPPRVSVRLRGGLNDREGRVEVFFRDVWGTICDDNWDAKDSGVICRMLGFIGASRAHNGSYFPSGSTTQPIWLDDVNCDGDEASIGDCQFVGWNRSNCNHNEDAGVTCLGVRGSTTTTTTLRPSTTTAPPRICNNASTEIRLMDENNHAWEGRVQVLYQGTWHEVCDDAWGLINAQVVCKMLCYNPANARAHLGPAYGNMTETILLDNVKCQGTEDSLLDCPANSRFSHDCTASEGAGVSCIPDEPSPPSAPDPEIECQNELISAHFPRNANDRLRPDHLSVINQTTCGYTTSMDGQYVTIAIPFVGCGTERQINETHIIYSNQVRYDVPPIDPVISWTQSYDVPVFCVMGRNDDPEDAVKPETETVGPQYGNGQFQVDMAVYKSHRFAEKIQQFPAEVGLGKWVYVGLSLTTTDTSLKIVLQDCFTTPTAQASSEPSYHLIKDKCKVDSSVLFYPINQTMFAYRFRSFTFLDSSNTVYIHCKVYICGEEEKHSRCDRSCSAGKSRKRRKRDVGDSGKDYDIFFSNHTLIEKEKGPLVFVSLNQSSPTTTAKIGYSQTMLIDGSASSTHAVMPSGGSISSSTDRTTTNIILAPSQGGSGIITPKISSPGGVSSGSCIHCSIFVLTACMSTLFTSQIISR